jgi:hypothetical protein
MVFIDEGQCRERYAPLGARIVVRNARGVNPQKVFVARPPEQTSADATNRESPPEVADSLVRCIDYQRGA